VHSIKQYAYTGVQKPGYEGKCNFRKTDLHISGNILEGKPVKMVYGLHADGYL
jgi:hypothetical protein